MTMTDELREQLKTEYILTGISLRKLADKYGIPRGTVTRIASTERWYTLRQAESPESVKKHVLPSGEPIIQATMDAARKITEATDKLMVKVYQLLDLDEPLSPRDLKSISGALLDAKILYNVKSDAERREQEARIRQLEKSVEEKQQEDKTITVVFGNGEELV